MRKIVWPVIGLIVMAILTTVQEALRDNQIGAQEWVLVVLQALMAFNVWATANLPQYERMKTWVSVAITVTGGLHVFILGGVDIHELVNLGIMALSALGVASTSQPLTRVINGTTVPPSK